MSQIDGSSPTRKYRLDPDDVLRLNNIEVRRETRYYTVCPRCSAKRKTIHQKLKCLGVTRPDPGRVYWGCNHCCWTGPGGGVSGPRIRAPNVQVKPAPQRLFASTTRTLYNYTDRLRKVKIRYPDGGKKMWWEYRKPRLIWEAGTGGIDTEPLLYRLIVAKKMAQYYRLPICIVEGESDVDRLMHIAIPATCNAHGASEPGKAAKWKACHSEQLVDFDIAIFNDNDEAGYAHADAVASCSSGKVKSIRLLDHALHFGDTKDISEWLRAGGSKADLLDFIAGAPEC